MRSLLASEVTAVAGLRCTTVARTLVDLAATEPRRRVEQALDQSERLGLLDEDEVARAARRRRPGAPTLRRILAEHAPGTTVTRSELEKAFLAPCRRAGIPQPVVNAPLVLLSGRPIAIDALWPVERLAIELDGRCGHLRRRTFEGDRARDVELTLAGYVPARFTWLQVTRRPAAVARQVLGLLATARRRRNPPGDDAGDGGRV